MELLIHVAWRAAVVNQELVDRDAFINEVREQLGVPKLVDLLPCIKTVRATATQLQVIEDQQALVTQAMEQLRQQHARIKKARAEAEQARRMAEAKPMPLHKP